MSRSQTALLLALLALAATVAYLPALTQPLIEDDFPNLAIAQTYGAPAAWRTLADSVFRLRATSEWLMWASYRAFRMTPAPYYAISILLHVACTWLVFALGAWRPIGYRIAAGAAFFFAIYEGHQEAVMWFSACNELLQFAFGVGAMVCWLHFQEGGRRRAWWYAAMLASLALALVSKESAAIAAVLLVLTTDRRKWPWLAPPVALAMVCALSVYLTRDNSFRFQDGSFSLHAPVWKIWPENFARLFWFWGLLAIVPAWTRHRGAALRGLAWAGVALVPYSFLIYSARIPSRQVYLASAGLAILVGTAFDFALERRREFAAIICLAMLLHNVGYLWTRKRAQFLERAEPTRQLIQFARHTSAPIYIQCFPRPGLIAQEALHLGAGKPLDEIVWNAEEARARGAATFCYREPKRRP